MSNIALEVLLAALAQIIIILSAVWAFSNRIENRLTRLETQSTNFDKNIDDLWKNLNIDRRHQKQRYDHAD